MPELKYTLVIDDDEAKRKLENWRRLTQQNTQLLTREQATALTRMRSLADDERRSMDALTRSMNAATRARETDSNAVVKAARAGRELAEARRADARAAVEQARAEEIRARAMRASQNASRGSGFALPRTFAGFTAAGFAQAAGFAGGLNIAGNAVDFLRESKNAARDLNEQVNKTNVVFKNANGAILEFSRNAASGLGMSRTEALQAAGSFGALLEQLELGPQKTADMSKELVKLASDLASFHNIKPEEALEKLRAGLAGEMEPLRALGVHLDDATLRLRALNMGLVENTKTVLPPQIKMQAAYAEIMAQTKNAQGDFARTSKEVANSERILRAEIEDTKAELGKNFLPIYKTLLNLTNELVVSTKSLADGMSNLGNTKPGPGLSQFLENIKDAVEIFRLNAGQASFEKSPVGKVAKLRDDASYFRGFVGANGQPIFPKDATEAMTLKSRLSEYGYTIGPMTGSADYKGALLGAAGAAESQYGTALKTYRDSIFTTPDSKSAGQRFNESYSEKPTTPSYILRMRAEAAEKARIEAAKKAKREAAAARAQQSANMRIFNEARVVGGDNIREEEDYFLRQYAKSAIARDANARKGFAGFMESGTGFAASVVSTNNAVKEMADAQELLRKEMEFTSDLQSRKDKERLKGLRDGYDQVLRYLQDELPDAQEKLDEALKRGDKTAFDAQLSRIRDIRARMSIAGAVQSATLSPSFGPGGSDSVLRTREFGPGFTELSQTFREVNADQRQSETEFRIRNGKGTPFARAMTTTGGFAADSIGQAVADGILSGSVSDALQRSGRSIAQVFVRELTSEALTKPLTAMFKDLGKQIAAGGAQAGASIYQAVGALYGLFAVAGRKRKTGFGSILGGLAGLVIGGPLGAISGYNVGNALDNGDYLGAGMGLATGIGTGAFNPNNGLTLGTKDLGQVGGRSVNVNNYINTLNEASDAGYIRGKMINDLKTGLSVA